MAEKIIYICSPYRGNVAKNTETARKLCRQAALHGYTVICPHLLYPQFLDDTNRRERTVGIQSGLKLLELADAMLVGGGKISEGMCTEIRKARELGIPIFCTDGTMDKCGCCCCMAGRSM